MAHIADNDSTLKYEVNTTHKKVFNLFFTSILNNLPASVVHLIKKSNYSAHHVIENKTSHEALETLYSCGHSHPSSNLLNKLFRSIWFNVDNSKAVRNRLKLVKKELKVAFSSIIDREEKIELLSIASGSARSVVEAISEAGLTAEKIRASFLDKNPNALDYSKRLVSKCGLKNFHFRWFNDVASNFPVYFANAKPNLVEMVGLLDYFSFDKTLSLLKVIYNNLPKGGILITANISDNRERKFVTNIVGWHMIYKNADELRSLAISAGFNPDKIRVIYEPLRIHCVLIAEK
ncbi:MAG TPA: class I SAM-dependent methyltransferase family protein [Candidatus Paceibacterota bacterium]